MIELGLLILLIVLVFPKIFPAKDDDKAQSRSSATPKPLNYVDNDLNARWEIYIKSFQGVVRTKAEKRLLQALLSRKLAGELYSTSSESSELPDKASSADQPQSNQHSDMESIVGEWDDESSMSSIASDNKSLASAQITPTRQVVKLDGTTLLLYFGAFLLVASAGLFVAISTLGGLIRTLVLALVTAGLYVSGFWLFKNKSKLRQAGLSFMGSAMVIMPLVGVAFYNLVTFQTNGPIVWLATSLLCALVYVHALTQIRTSFMAYLLIGSFVSTVEASIMVLGVPYYVFTWGLVVSGVILLLVGKYYLDFKELAESSNVLAKFLAPVSLISSLIMLVQYGSGQLSITLFLTAVFYGMITFQTDTYREWYALFAQMSAALGIASLVNNISHSLALSGLVLGSIGVAYAGLVWIIGDEKSDRYNVGHVLSLLAVLGVVASVGNSKILWISTSLAVLALGAKWLKRRGEYGLGVAGFLLIGLPFVIGQYRLSPRMDLMSQLMISATAGLILLGVVLITYRGEKFQNSRLLAETLLLTSILPLLVMSFAIGFSWVVWLSVALLSVFVSLKFASGSTNWFFAAGLVSAVPACFALVSIALGSKEFSLALFGSLAVNIIIALYSRLSAQRWLLSGIILLTPLAIAGGGLGFEADLRGYTVLYLLVMASFILARAIALGKMLFSSKKAIRSYTKASSVVYVVGYVFSAVIALLLSLDSTSNPQVFATIVLVCIAIASMILAYYVERNLKLLYVVPIVAQFIVLNVIRIPVTDDTYQITTVATVISTFMTGAAYLLYIAVRSQKERLGSVYSSLLKLIVWTAYGGPLTSLLYWMVCGLKTRQDVFIFLPISLGLAGLLTVHFNRYNKQSTLEWSIGAIIASYHWLLYLGGVSNIHIHTHLLALALAGFAYWRWTQEDDTGYRHYVVASFFIATVPLVLQALNSVSGEFYGLFLIIQQAVFLTIGVFLRNKLLIRFALWTAIGSVLFQLRNLGWAFVALLAVVIIGVAVYRLQFHNLDDDDRKTN